MNNRTSLNERINERTIHSPIWWLACLLHWTADVLRAGMGSVLVTAVSPASPRAEPGMEGVGGPKGRQLYVCKDSCEQISVRLRVKDKCWISSSGELGLGVILGTFISTYKGSYREERTPPALESRCVTLLPQWPPFCSLNLQAHSSIKVFWLPFPLWEPCSHSSWSSSYTWASMSQLKEHLRKTFCGKAN